MTDEQPDGMIQFKWIMLGPELREKFNNDLIAYSKVLLQDMGPQGRRDVVVAIEDVLARNLSNAELVEWWLVGRPNVVFWEGLDHLLPMILREAKAAVAAGPGGHPQ